MPTTIYVDPQGQQTTEPRLGTEQKEIDIIKLLPPDEGEINQIYGRIGSGKTYCATKDIIDDLNRGQLWYINWKIDWNGKDERKSKLLLLLRSLGIKINFYEHNKSNLKYIDLDDLKNIKVNGQSTGKDFVTWLSSITDAKIGLDEGHIAFNSYEKTRISMEKINSVMWTRHFDRSYLIISQRPTAIHITMRANVNRFYKCEKIVDWKIRKIRLLKFKKTEFQDTTENDIPNEAKIKKLNEKTHMLEDTDEYQYAVSTKSYWGKKKIFKLYDSKYRRQQLGSSQTLNSKIYRLTPKEAWGELWTVFKKKPSLEKLENKNKNWIQELKSKLTNEKK